MAENKKAAETTEVKKFRIKVKSNPNFCGIDAGGIQFAHGEAVINNDYMANWFREHDGYEVDEIS